MCRYVALLEMVAAMLPIYRLDKVELRASETDVEVIIRRMKLLERIFDGQWQPSLLNELSDAVSNQQMVGIFTFEQILCRLREWALRELDKEQARQQWRRAKARRWVPNVELGLSDMYDQAQKHEADEFFQCYIDPSAFDNYSPLQWFLPKLKLDDNLAFLLVAMVAMHRMHQERKLKVEYWRLVMRRTDSFSEAEADAHLQLVDLREQFTRENEKWRQGRLFSTQSQSRGKYNRFRWLLTYCTLALGCSLPVGKTLALHLPSSHLGRRNRLLFAIEKRNEITSAMTLAMRPYVEKWLSEVELNV